MLFLQMKSATQVKPNQGDTAWLIIISSFNV
jgi:hypothetical protein